MHAEDRRMVDAIEPVLPEVARAITLIAERLRRGGHLLYVGAGTSGRLGVLDASECPPTFSTPPSLVRGIIAGGPDALTRAVEGAEDDRDGGYGELRATATPDDTVVGLSASGRAPYVLGALIAAREAGALCIGIACAEEPALAPLCDVVLAPVTGPEVLTGSTRLKAGSAQKLLLNMLSTGAMVQLGKVYDNLMVDLSPTNLKLRSRARRIVEQIAGASDEAATAALEASGWEPKTAVVVLKRAVTPDDARSLLSEAGGSLRRALE